MTINLADNNPRNDYTVSDGNSQTVFTMDFEIFDNADLNVYVDGTLKTITTDYKISDDVSDANAGHTSGTDGFVHFTSAITASGSDVSVVLTRDIDLKRTTDFPASGAFQIDSLNTELDKLVAIAADLNDEIGRSLRLTDYDTSVSLVLPTVDSRKGKVLAFNATTGAVESGPSISGVTTVSAMAADIATLADIEDGTVATDAISNLAAIDSNVTTVAGIASNVTTVAGISSDVTAVAGDATDIGTVSSNIANVNTVAGIDSNVTTVAGIQANVTTVAGIQANVTTVAGISSNVTTVAGIDTEITTVAGDSADIQTVAGDSADIQLLADNIATISAKENVGVAVAMAIALG